MTPAAASSPYADPPVSITASTRPWCVSESVSSSRVPVARPNTQTAPREALSMPRMTVRPVAPFSSDA